MTPALDEVSTEYGLLAEAVSYPEDHSIGHLSIERAKHVGTTASRSRPDDVIYSFDVYENRTARFTAPTIVIVNRSRRRRARNHLHLRRAGNRELPQIVGQLPVLPEALVGRD